MPGGGTAYGEEQEAKHYVYDVHDRLIHEYCIDPDDPETVFAETKYVLQDGRQVLILETSLNRTSLLLPDPTGDRMLAEQWRCGFSNDTIWPMHDRLGTVVAAFAEDWYPNYEDIQCFQYDAFGTPKFDPEHDPSLANRLQILHVGRRYDSNTRLYYNRARWYDPQSGRFLSEDPIASDINLYRYCGNSPTNATDPTGHFAFVTTAGLIALGTYLFKAGAESAVETYVESKVADWTGDESFSFWGAFGRNMGVNTAIGWMPGAVETKIGAKAARLGTKVALKTAQYGAEYAVETGVDVGIATLVHGRDFGNAFREAALGNAIGHGVFRPVVHYAGRGLSAAGRWVGRELKDVGIIDPGGINLGWFRITTALGMVDPSPGRTVAGEITERLVRHHTVPKEILSLLPTEIAKAVRGRPGAPNRWRIPESLHKRIHSGAYGGGDYNEAFKNALKMLRREPTAADVTRIRDDLVRQFGIEGYRL